MHSRWVAAATGLALAMTTVTMTSVMMISPAGARHHRQRSAPHPAPAVQSAPVVQQPQARMEPPPPGARSVDQAAVARGETGTSATAPSLNAPSATVVDTRDVRAVLGKGVRSNTGEDMGRLVDVVVDREGQPRAAIIDFGGFLGVGSRKIAVDWAALNFSTEDPKGNSITLELTRDQVKAAPEFKEGNPIVVLGALGGAQPAPAAAAKTEEQKTQEQRDQEQKAQKTQEQAAPEPAAPPKAQEK
jgi:PRC-barrel domain